MTMYMATIPKYKEKESAPGKGSDEEEIEIAPEDEIKEFQKTLGL